MNGRVFTSGGLFLMIIGFMVLGVETVAYGGHFISQSPTEAISELTVVIVILTGYVLFLIGQSSKRS